jgi:glycine cleavage system H lipoate-binding protein
MSFKIEEDDREFRVNYNNTVMHFPKQLYYSEQDMWARVGEFSGVATVGLTDYPMTLLSEITALEIKIDPETAVSPIEEIGFIKSSETEFRLFPPISGTIIAVNSKVKDDFEAVKDNYERGWLFKINPSDLNSDLRDLCINARYYIKVLKERLEI